MQYRLLGNTGLKVSALCLGTMTWGGTWRLGGMGNLGQEAVDEQFKHAMDAGINFIDTANVYSDGLSETLTGQSIRNLGLHRDDLVLATKVRGRMGTGPNDNGLSRKHIFQQVEASLKRLGTDYIDLYQVHSYDPLTPLEETLRALDDLVRSGKVRYIGASNLAAWQLMKALSYSDHRQLERFVSLQAYYSLAGRDLERELIPLLLDQHVGLMVWSPLVGGLLTGKYKRGAAPTSDDRLGRLDLLPADKERAFNIVDVLQPIAASKNASIAQVALAWLLHQPAVSSVIIGANKLSQLNDNLGSVNIQLSAEELSQLDQVSRLPTEYPQWILEMTGGDRQQ